MSFASTRRLAEAARAGGYAVPAVNIVDQLSLRAVVDAADEAKSPVILQTSVKTVTLLGAASLGSYARAVAEAAEVPVALHLDHCPDRSVITEVIRHGWSSVLFDASDRPLHVAREETAKVVAEAHAAQVDVESEIENIIGVEDGVGSEEAVHSYTAAQLVEVADQTGADLIAPQLGTAHGLYKASPVLLFDRVRELTSLTDLSIVLHGGTGLSPEEFAGFIAAGVSKINISTALKLSYMHSARDHLAAAENTGKWEPVKLFEAIAAAVRTTVAEHIAQFGSAGKAGAA